jgi:hypothetical protein
MVSVPLSILDLAAVAKGDMAAILAICPNK